MPDPSPLWKRLAGFTLVPAIAAISPLLVLPIVSRTAGPSGWSSAIAGEAVGTVAAITIGYGWASIGPALVSIAKDDAHRGSIYRESIVVRLTIALAALPIMGVICWLIASPGSEWLSVLMGLQGALIALSFAWFAAGTGDPRSIIFFDALPRLLVTIVAAFVIAHIGIVELYPMAGIAVTLIGTGLFTVRVLARYPAPWPRARELSRMFRAGFPVALNDVALSAYSSVPAPLVNVTATPIEAAGFASADKMLKLGQFLPMTLANALQAWIGEAHGPHRRRRMRQALAAHGGFGLLGGILLAVFGSWASLILFGAQAQATTGVLIALGVTFALFSLRTSMTRHVLFPAGESRAVLRATLVATAIGVPAMIGLGIVLGPIGAATGYALTEGAATVLLIRRCVEAMRRLDAAAPIAP
ncbi:lipopolysaccharide biosynthesis protein [Microbacterium pygmaeum]|uniref:Polysaccharide transporter, PST family n=1 Tax=Microbacterium pygmaeum TaxID=370764 RepID=A0A1G8CSN1_9MICO|nr:hypothetical protein [Microbacterium pygmaeum]SDH48179.1 polysaccharide transporter, PST family [Microbacterium pygmaeum]